LRGVRSLALAAVCLAVGFGAGLRVASGDDSGADLSACVAEARALPDGRDSFEVKLDHATGSDRHAEAVHAAIVRCRSKYGD
jgi:hypothetical protein